MVAVTVTMPPEGVPWAKSTVVVPAPFGIAIVVEGLQVGRPAVGRGEIVGRGRVERVGEGEGVGTRVTVPATRPCVKLSGAVPKKFSTPVVVAVAVRVVVEAGLAADAG